MSGNNQCPRDQALLAKGAGALTEDVCPTCQGRFLDAAALRRLLVEIMGIPEHVLHELAREGAQKLTCPSCASRMTETWARGVQVDLCRGCGGGWLDGGELQRLAKDTVGEVRVDTPVLVAADGAGAPTSSSSSSGLELGERGAPQPMRFAVHCVNCDAVLDLTKVNWLVNTRPWCPTCAKPYSGLLSGFGSSIVTVLFELFTSRSLLFRLFDDRTGAPWDKQPDVLRIAPDDADKYFGAFYRRQR